MARKAKRSASRSKKAAKRRVPARKAPARKAAKRGAAASIPAGFRSVTPYLVLRNTAQAIDFYKKALGAIERRRLPSPDGIRVMHAEIQVGDSIIMMSDEFPEYDTGAHAPEVLGGTTGSIHLYAEDVDALFERAVAAGMTVMMPLADAFWGDRFGKLKDPFGHQWSLGKQLRKMTTEQIAEAARAAFAPKG